MKYLSDEPTQSRKTKGDNITLSEGFGRSDFQIWHKDLCYQSQKSHRLFEVFPEDGQKNCMYNNTKMINENIIKSSSI